jgi:hypothetical protein
MRVENFMRKNLGPGSGRFEPHVSRPVRTDRKKPLPPGKKLNVADEMPKGRELVVAAAAPAREMKVVAWKAKDPECDSVASATDRRSARWTGIGACVCVGIWWLNSAMDWLSSRVLESPASLWDRIAIPMFFIALFGSHALAAVGSAAFKTRDPWAIRAVACFWASVLLWLPVGTLIAMVRDLLA